MPRFTNKEYLQRHEVARRIWQQYRGKFGDLSVNQQWDLHDFYRPSEELTAEALIEHRRRVSRERPSLAALANKAYKILVDPNPPTAVSVTPAAAVGSKRAIRVRAIVRPTPDLRKLARALIELAEEQAREGLEAE